MKKIYVILLLCLAGFRADISRTISGTIYDDSDKQPLPGAAILVRNEKTSATTDVNGRYSVQVHSSNPVLVFNKIGYETREMKPGKSASLDIWLKPTGKFLNEVVAMSKTAPRLNSISDALALAPGMIQGKVQGIRIQRTGYPYENSESYARISENQFQDPKNIPLSTFAIDVDAASYANVRRFINNGQLPPKDAVRIEEMINYFHYDLKAPINDDPVAIHTEYAVAPWNPQHGLLRIGLKAKNVKTEDLPPSNLVFLVDVSGSMNAANKLPLVQSSLKLLVDQLRPADRVALVVYAGAAGLKLASTSCNEKTRIKDAIDALASGGSTAGGAGLRLAYKVARQNFIRGGNNRIILATDGDFNVGDSGDKDMEHLIEEERGDGVSISILGFGMGNYKDSKMEILADKGHGNYAYIDNMTEATKAMVTEFGGTLFTVAKDVKLQVEFNPAKVQAYRLLGYENRLMAKEDFNNDNKLGGDMGVGHSVTALYEIIPPGVESNFTGTVDPLKYQSADNRSSNSNSPELATIKFRYKHPESEKSKMVQVTVGSKPKQIATASDDFRFAASVAEFGLLLRHSDFKQRASFTGLIDRAKNAKGRDDEGYRAEFVRLAVSAELLAKSTDPAFGAK